MSFRSVVILTGAGISAESGVDTFRDLGGLWEQYRVEDIASPEAFRRDPDFVHRFYNIRRRQLLSGDIRPNAAHQALERLQQAFPGTCLLVTQNIDDLHERAGSRSRVHMHGELLKARCQRCEAIREAPEALSAADTCTGCGCVGALRPHVVWFGETPLEMDRIAKQLEQCNLFLSVGTSGNVYPAAGFVDVARAAGARTVELNQEQTEIATLFDRTILGRATETVPAFVDDLLRGR